MTEMWHKKARKAPMTEKTSLPQYLTIYLRETMCLSLFSCAYYIFTVFFKKIGKGKSVGLLLGFVLGFLKLI